MDGKHIFEWYAAATFCCGVTYIGMWWLLGVWGIRCGEVAARNYYHSQILVQLNRCTSCGYLTRGSSSGARLRWRYMRILLELGWYVRWYQRLTAK
jgi:hypothetical protein